MKSDNIFAFSVFFCFAFLFCTGLISICYAQDMVSPPWRGQKGSTWQVWNFEDSSNPSSPSDTSNEYGESAAVITAVFPGGGWLSELGLGDQQTGIWDIGTGTIILTIPNRPLALPQKDIWLQVIYFEGLVGKPQFQVTSAEFISETTETVEDLGFWGAWRRSLTKWKIEPNPNQEQIIITADNAIGSIISAVTVDTLCGPEPDADLTGDGQVNQLDVLILGTQWLSTTGNLEADIAPPYGVVDYVDYALIVQSWNPN